MSPIVRAWRRIVCVVLGHKVVRHIAGFKVTHITTGGGVAGGVTASTTRCDRCGHLVRTWWRGAA